MPLAVAILLAAMLPPVTNRLRRWGVPRGLAARDHGAGRTGADRRRADPDRHPDRRPGPGPRRAMSSTGFNQLVDWLQNGPLHVSQAGSSIDSVGQADPDLPGDSQSTITTYAAEIGTQVGHFVAGFCDRPVLAVLLPLRRPADLQLPAEVLPPGLAGPGRPGGAAAAGPRCRTTSGPPILVALSDAIGVLIAALILGVPLAPALAALVFIGAFVPIVGAFVSGFVAVIVALVALGWVKALIMLAAIILVMQVEGHVLQPFLLGRAVKLHPLAVMLAIAIGIIVGGIVGALMAVPLLAFGKSFVQHLGRMPDEPTGRPAPDIRSVR